MNFCPNIDCRNNASFQSEWPNDYYRKLGRNKSGTQIYQCKSCNRRFLAKNPDLDIRQYAPYLNKVIFRLLIGGRSIRRICDETTIKPIRLFRKVDYWDEQLSLFEKGIFKRATNMFEGDAKCFEAPGGNLLFCLEEKSGYVTKFGILGEAPQKGVGKRALVRTGFTPLAEKFFNLAKKNLFIFDDIQLEPEAYNPDFANQVFNIFRIHYNFRVRSNEKKTPAMVAGLTSKPSDLDQIISPPL